MIDPAVERQYADTQELLGLWNTFHQFFALGRKGEGITPANENQFLELKSRIAMLHDSFMDALQDNQNVGQDVLNIITRAITLRHLGKLSSPDLKKMESEWHEAYLLLNDTVAALDQRRRELAEINESQYKAKKAAGAARQSVGNFVGHFYFKLAVIIAVLLAATIGVQALGFYDYDKLGDIPALRTPFQWGKHVVRIVKPESPWPNIDVVPRKAYASWPGGVKPPKTDSDMDQQQAARFIAGKTAALRIQDQVYPALEKAVEYRKEVAEKSGESPVEIYSFRFATAEEAKKAYEIWDDAKTARTTEVPLLDEMDWILDTNVVIVITTGKKEVLWKMVSDVYGKKA